MKEQVDIVSSNGKDSNCSIYPQKNAPVYTGDYTGLPIFGPAPLEECLYFCESNSYPYRVRCFGSVVPPRFFVDLEKRFDDWYSKLSDYAFHCGRKLVSHITHGSCVCTSSRSCSSLGYCYTGDMGGTARLALVDSSKSDSDSLLKAKSYLNSLISASICLWELGFVVTFDTKGKHKITDINSQWITLDITD